MEADPFPAEHWDDFISIHTVSATCENLKSVDLPMSNYAIVWNSELQKLRK